MCVYVASPLKHWKNRIIYLDSETTISLRPFISLLCAESGVTFYPNTPKYTFVTRVIKMINFITYKHRCNMTASNKYKCTQTHSKFIWYMYVLLTYNKYISSNTLLFILFIYLIPFLPF